MISGGLNPVFIPYNAKDDELYKVLSQVNGVFFTGGDLELYDPVTDVPHQYTVTAQKIVDYSIKATDSGDYFPILGVCQGHELLHMLVANDSKALGWSQAENLNLNTYFRVAHTESRMLAYFDSVIIEAMSSQNLLMHLHHRGILMETYNSYPSLNEFFKIVSTNNINGVDIVSTAEAHNYPIYLVQYHPEAVYDPVSDLKSNRAPINFQVAQQFADFFAYECNRNEHKFESQEDLDMLLAINGTPGKIIFLQKPVNAYGFDN